MRLKKMRPESMLAQRPRRPAPQQSGFALVAAMFVIIIIALVIAAMMRMAGNQHGTNSLAIQQARAYQAARSGLEWGISSALAGSQRVRIRLIRVAGISGQSLSSQNAGHRQRRQS